MISPLTPKAGSTVQFRGVPLTPPIDCADPASWIADRIYQMGADQELEACVEWIEKYTPTGYFHTRDLRAARRPKRLSRKSQGFDALDRLTRYNGDTEARAILLDILEALPDDTI